MGDLRRYKSPRRNSFKSFLWICKCPSWMDWKHVVKLCNEKRIESYEVDTMINQTVFCHPALFLSRPMPCKIFKMKHMRREAVDLLANPTTAKGFKKYCCKRDPILYRKTRQIILPMANNNNMYFFED